ncbi:MAG: UDP-N-acetylmuramoyl-L-alanyl-D-glutamate--2,6-diaminopimelate ligase [Lachnospiraceae bacterium]|nr:UDP-N-acetylmuramoyl-L-alanyl-D-glutamate--2,6-diaminopimelate ligase [Lachnospiraceae bacterium]
MRINNVDGLEYELIQGTDSTEYDSLVYDSRKVIKGCLFVCLKGLKFDSHDVINAVVTDGAAGIIIDHDCNYPDGVNVYRVENTRKALALCSAAHFEYPAGKMTVIAITGTKGKTTTALMVRHLIEKTGAMCGYIGTNGIYIGEQHIPTLNTTPESYEVNQYFSQMVDAGCKYAVIEASSQAFLMHRLDGIYFDYALFTNIANDHIGDGEHKDFEEYLNCKVQLFRQSRAGLVNIEDEHSEYVISNSLCSTMTTFGKKPGADYWYDGLELVQNDKYIGSVFELHHGNDSIKCSVSIPGEFNADNALAAFSIIKEMGFDNDFISSGLNDINICGRMELVHSTEDLKVIVDFAHNEMATVNLVRTLKSYNPKRLVIVFGCGGNRSKERRYGMGRVVGENADFAIITEDNNRMEPFEDICSDIHSTFDKTGCKYIDIPLRPDAVRYAICNHKPGDMVAIIGKGHESGIDKNGTVTPYTDQEAVRDVLKESDNR